MATFGAMSQAIAANTTLPKLVLSKEFASTAMYGKEYLRRILRDLKMNPGLHTLCLHGSHNSIGDPNDISLISNFLISISTLQHLSLTEFKFERKTMTYLLDGLRANQSVDEVSFLSCKFNKASTNLFIGYMQTDRRLSRHNIGKLHITYDEYTFAAMKIGKFAHAIVTMPLHARNSSIGCSLQALYLARSDHNNMARVDYSDFLDELASNRFQKSPLEILCLQHLAYQCMPILPRCVSRLDSLLDLNVCIAWGSEETGDVMVKVLRQHGMIRKVSIFQLFQPYFNKLQSALVDAYCQRNILLPAIVSRPQMTKGGDGVDDDNDSGMRDWSLFPTLFQAAMQARNVGPRNVLIGLRAFEDTIGPHHHDGKRKL